MYAKKRLKGCFYQEFENEGMRMQTTEGIWFKGMGFKTMNQIPSNRGKVKN